MPNKRYQAGAKVERRVVNYLRRFGFTATRAAGSKSPFDVIASNSKSCWHIQVKNRPPTNAIRLLADLMDVTPDNCKVALAYPLANGHLYLDTLGEPLL